jgi:hypothetical protein
LAIKNNSHKRALSEKKRADRFVYPLQELVQIEAVGDLDSAHGEGGVVGVVGRRLVVGHEMGEDDAGLDQEVGQFVPIALRPRLVVLVVAQDGVHRLLGLARREEGDVLLHQRGQAIGDDALVDHQRQRRPHHRHLLARRQVDDQGDLLVLGLRPKPLLPSLGDDILQARDRGGGGP